MQYKCITYNVENKTYLLKINIECNKCTINEGKYIEHFIYMRMNEFLKI